MAMLEENGIQPSQAPKENSPTSGLSKFGDSGLNIAKAGF
jgi:hypothetical protein